MAQSVETEHGITKEEDAKHGTFTRSVSQPQVFMCKTLMRKIYLFEAVVKVIWGVGGIKHLVHCLAQSRHSAKGGKMTSRGKPPGAAFMAALNAEQCGTCRKSTFTQTSVEQIHAHCSEKGT